MERPMTYDRIVRRLLVAAAVVTAAWSATAWPDWFALFRDLRGRSLVDRGAIGSDEARSFLARAGRAGVQRAFRDARQRATEDHPSPVAKGWSWIVAHESELPADAKIYLSIDSELYYFYATSLWYPRPVDVSAEPGMIKDGDTLREVARPIRATDLDGLRRAGYTHAVGVTKGDLRIVDLADRDDP